MEAPPDDRLIVSCDYGSQSVFALKEAAHDLCEIIWLVDLSVPEMVQMARLMARMGTVVDIAGSSEQQVVDLLGAAEPTGLLNLGDNMAVRLAHIASALGLPFHSPEVAGYLSDKFLQRQALRSAGIPAPDFRELSSRPDSADLELFAQEIGFPAVLKPRMGTGSRNTYKVHNQEELTRIMSVLGPWQHEQAGMILESYLAGTDRPVSRFDPVVSVESYIHSGEVRHISVTGRFPFAEPFRETGLVLPSDLSAADASDAKGTAAAAIAALGINHGCLHTELKFTRMDPGSSRSMDGSVAGFHNWWGWPVEQSRCCDSRWSSLWTYRRPQSSQSTTRESDGNGQFLRRCRPTGSTRSPALTN